MKVREFQKTRSFVFNDLRRQKSYQVAHQPRPRWPGCLCPAARVVRGNLEFCKFGRLAEIYRSLLLGSVLKSRASSIFADLQKLKIVVRRPLRMPQERRPAAGVYLSLGGFGACRERRPRLATRQPWRSGPRPGRDTQWNCRSQGCLFDLGPACKPHAHPNQAKGVMPPAKRIEPRGRGVAAQDGAGGGHFPALYESASLAMNSALPAIWL